MRHLVLSKVIAACAAIACVSILSGCWHHRRDPAYVERVHVDEHHDDHHEDHHDDRR